MHATSSSASTSRSPVIKLDARAFDRPETGAVLLGHAQATSVRKDAGAHDTHIVGIHVCGLSVTLTYTATHGSGAAFLQQVLAPCGEAGAAAGRDSRYEIRVGCCRRGDRLHRQNPMCLGSHLVFRVDRERARKRLERLVRRADAVVLLKWAAAERVGQCTFLQVGSRHIITTALEPTPSVSMRAAVRLDELLGQEGGRAFLMMMLAIVSTGLANHDSPRLINDQIDAALLDYPASADHAMLTAVADHVTLVLAWLDRIRTAMTTVPPCGNDAWGARVEDIDRRSGRLLQPVHEQSALRRPLAEARRIALALEQSAATLSAAPRADHLRAALLDTLAEGLGHSARAYLDCLDNARHIRRMPASGHLALERLLIAVDRLADLAHQSDATAPIVEALLLQHRHDRARADGLSGVAHVFRDAIASFARCSVIVRDYAFNAGPGAQ